MRKTSPSCEASAKANAAREHRVSERHLGEDAPGQRASRAKAESPCGTVDDAHCGSSRRGFSSVIAVAQAPEGCGGFPTSVRAKTIHEDQGVAQKRSVRGFESVEVNLIGICVLVGSGVVLYDRKALASVTGGRVTSNVDPACSLVRLSATNE